MTAEQFFVGLGYADAEYLAAAAPSLTPKVTSTKNHKSLRFVLVAAALILLLTAIILPIALGSDSISTPVATTPKIPTTEKTYYYQTVDNFFEIESDMRGSSEYFRHDETVLSELKSPTVEVTATIPSSVVWGNQTYQLTEEPIERSGRDLYYGITDHAQDIYDAETITPYVVIDAITGKVNGMRGVYLQSLTSEQLAMEWEALARSILATYLPHVDLSGFVVDQVTANENGYGAMNLFRMRHYIDGYMTDKFIQVAVNQGKILDVMVQNYNNYEELDLSSLAKIDQEEHQKILNSYIDYAKNGNVIEEPKYSYTRIAWAEDGKYLLEYNIVIKVKDTAYRDWLKLCIVLEDDIE